jgi:cytosine/adenosine deaminase-related metal-dependent hydrolase
MKARGSITAHLTPVVARFVSMSASLMARACSPVDTITLQDGIITAVAMESDVAIPIDAATIEGAGQTVPPGLIDAHTHTFDPSGLRQALIFGVTTELDMFTDWRLYRLQVEHDAARGDVSPLPE